jgi:hypothetical protein
MERTTTEGVAECGPRAMGVGLSAQAPKKLAWLRKITAHQAEPNREVLELLVADEPGPGGAHHEYLAYWPHNGGHTVTSLMIRFQKGPILENGVNGLTQELLLAIVEDRLSCFENGPYACAANATALEHVRAALQSLKDRTLERRARKVEGDEPGLKGLKAKG